MWMQGQIQHVNQMGLLFTEQSNPPARQGRAGGFSCIHLPERAHFLGLRIAACAAASRAIGTRKGLQET